MNRAESKAGQVDSAVLELAEAVVLTGRVGETFDGTGHRYRSKARGAHSDLRSGDHHARPADGLQIGATVRLRLEEADPARRLTRFSVA
jgi:hypothetical protein